LTRSCGLGHLLGARGGRESSVKLGTLFITDPKLLELILNKVDETLAKELVVVLMQVQVLVLVKASHEL